MCWIGGKGQISKTDGNSMFGRTYCYGCDESFLDENEKSEWYLDTKREREFKQYTTKNPREGVKSDTNEASVRKRKKNRSS